MSYYHVGDRVRYLTHGSNRPWMIVTPGRITAVEGDRIQVGNGRQWITVDDEGIGVVTSDQIIEPDDPDFKLADDALYRIEVEAGAYPQQEVEPGIRQDDYNFKQEGERHGNAF